MLFKEQFCEIDSNIKDLVNKSGSQFGKELKINKNNEEEVKMKG